MNMILIISVLSTVFFHLANSSYIFRMCIAVSCCFRRILMHSWTCCHSVGLTNIFQIHCPEIPYWFTWTTAIAQNLLSDLAISMLKFIAIARAVAVASFCLIKHVAPQISRHARLNNPPQKKIRVPLKQFVRIVPAHWMLAIDCSI